MAARFVTTRLLVHAWIAIAMASSASSGCSKGGHEAAPEPPDLQIVSTGNEPRKVLRYRIPKGTSQGIEVLVDMKVTAGEMGGPLPTIALSMLVAVEDVQPNGQMKLRTTIVDATARDRADTKVTPAAVAGPLDKLKGIAIENMLSPSGRVTKGAIEGQKQLPDDMAQQLGGLTSTLEQVMMPLPNEPVGVGAVWRSSRDIQQSGLKMTSVNTFSLVGLDGDKLQYTIDTDVHGADQTVKMDDASIDVKDITGTGGGNGSFSLTSLEATAVLSAEFRSQMSAPGETAPTPMKMVTQTKLAPQGQPMPSGSAAPPAEGSGSGGSGSAGSAAGSASGSAGSSAGSGS